MTQAARPDPLPVGAVLRRRFELVEVIGRGGITTVYRAVDHLRSMIDPADAEVAVKVMSADDGADAWALDVVHREAGYLRHLHHPNIVQVFDSDWDEPYHFLVLELLRGQTVGGIMGTMPNRRVPLDIVLRILDGAVRGLAHAHDRGIVHGDLKPNNVFVTLDGGVKLLDFGAARTLNGAGNPDFTESGFDAVTPIYASPEVLSGEEPSAGDDVFSLAVLAYVMLAGTHPFGGRTALEAEREGLRPPPPPGLSRRRWSSLAQALALDGVARIDTMDGFVQAIARPRLIDRLLG